MDNLPRNIAAAWVFFAVGVLAAVAALRWWAARVYNAGDE